MIGLLILSADKGIKNSGNFGIWKFFFYESIFLIE